MEGHKYKGARLPRAAGSVLDDGVGPEASSSDFLKHAACGVHDKHQCRDLHHTEEPVEGSLEGKMRTCYIYSTVKHCSLSNELKTTD